MNSYFFISESLSEGYPDKLEDRLSEGILEQDSTVRDAIKRIDYDNTEYGIDYKGCAVLVAYDKQSPDISQGVDGPHDDPLNQDASDQDIMFDYACDETPQLVQLPIWISHRIVECQFKHRKDGRLPWLRPDEKSQVTIKYEDGKPSAIDTLVLSAQYAPDMEFKDIREALIEEIIKPIFPKELIKGDIKYHINPTGRFVICGPQGDCCLKGHKIIVDNYGGATARGGGGFSGKDPSKVDRSAVYADRYITKNIVAAGLAERRLVQIFYAIGVAQPTSIMVETNGTGKVSSEVLIALVREHFDQLPKGIMKMLYFYIGSTPKQQLMAASVVGKLSSLGKRQIKRLFSRSCHEYKTN